MVYIDATVAAGAVALVFQIRNYKKAKGALGGEKAGFRNDSGFFAIEALAK